MSTLGRVGLSPRIGGNAMTNGFVLATDPTQPPRGLEGAVYAIGNFDGMHLGHRAVIERTVAVARSRTAPSALLTFEPHPADYFARRPVAFRLTPPKMKASLCARLGLSGIVFMSFDASLAEMSPEEFVAKVLVARLGDCGRGGWMGLSFRQRADPVRRPLLPRPVLDTALPSRSSPKLKTEPENRLGSCPLRQFAGLSNRAISPPRREDSGAIMRFPAGLSPASVLDGPSGRRPRISPWSRPTGSRTEFML